MKILITSVYILLAMTVTAQSGFPWQNPIMIARSNDGTNFITPVIFQDSSGVPCVIRWKGDTLVCVFQWFRQPMNTITWDRVAVKFSYDNGNVWTQPVPIVMNNLPTGFQRPFDPTVVVTDDKRIRIFYSSGKIPAGSDSVINTYSGISTDGINYAYEQDPRFDHPTKRLIDPAVVVFNGVWNYLSPVGAPQEGAYHCTSTNGLIFTPQANYPSDNLHNWTGNFVVANTNELRFYGSGEKIWYTTSTDANTWNGYVNTNLQGGDPGIVKLSTGSYIIIYVGQPYPLVTPTVVQTKVFPNPATTFLKIITANTAKISYKIYSSSGQLALSGGVFNNDKINVMSLSEGAYSIRIQQNSSVETYGFVIARK